MPRTRRSTSVHSISSSTSTTSTTSIPHCAPDPGPEHPLNLDHPREPGLTLSSFVGNPPPAPTEGDQPHWQVVASQLLAARNTFAARNAVADNPRCSAPDRSAVLAVYNEALMRVEHMSSLDATRLNLEVTTKVMTILELRSAEAGDPVFYVDSAFLSPLEPRYAEPRLDYYDRGEGSDGYGRAAWMRLREWRREGWPRVFPERAVEREERERERMERLERRVDEDLEGLERVAAREGGWREEVDADPERPWR